MGKKSKNRKLKRKKLKSNKNKDNSSFEKDKSNSNKEFRPKKNLALIHKRKEFKRKLKKIEKKNKNLFKVEHEILDEFYDFENLPHDKFTPYIIPNTHIFILFNIIIYILYIY